MSEASAVSPQKQKQPKIEQNEFQNKLKKSNNLITCLHLYKHEVSRSDGPETTKRLYTQNLLQGFVPSEGLMQRHRPLLLPGNTAPREPVVSVQ